MKVAIPTLSYPIPSTQSDNDFAVLSKEFNIIPYYGTSDNGSHGILKTLFDLYQYSPTKQAVTDGINDYAFGGDIQLEKRTYAGINTGVAVTNLVPISEIDAIVTFMFSIGLSFPQIIALSGALERNLGICGNAYLHYKEVTVAGVTRFYLKSIHPLKAAIRQDVPANTLIITDKWDKTYWAKFPPQNVALYPNFSTPENGVRETVFHIKTIRDESDFYGRPALSSLYWQFIETNMAMTVNKISSQDFVSAYMLLIEGMPPFEGNDDVAKENNSNLLQSLTTIKNGGKDAKTIVVSEYAHGNAPPTLHKFDLVRDSKYGQYVLDNAEAKILVAEKYPAELIGGSRSKSSIGGDKTVIYQMMRTNETLIKPKQQKMSSFWSLVFAEVSATTNNNLLDNYSIKFADKIEGLVTSMQNLDNNAATISNTATSV